MSSRLTSTQVIERGEYLNPEFDPTSLTMPHLLSILTLHGIKYPTPYNKSKLVQAFNEGIKPRIEQFKRERIQREGSVPSSRGIKDGLTGQSMSDEDLSEQAPPPRRSSRRLSRPSSLGPQQLLPPNPEPPKRRRSSAGPSFSRTSSKRTEPQEPALIEESEPEDEPVKKVGRPRKSVVAAGPQARRISHAEDVEGWSDNNVFQSGVESSSPVRPAPINRMIMTRRSTRKGRSSFSAPPQVPSSSPFADAPSSPTFDPRLPLEAEFPRRASRLQTPSGIFSNAALPRTIKTEPRSSSPLVEELEEENQHGGKALSEDEVPDSEESLTAEISRAIANGGSGRVVTPRRANEPQGLFSCTRITLGLIALVLAGITMFYKGKSASLGYCHAGTNTNAILGERKAALQIAQECTEYLASHPEEVYGNVTCSPIPLISFLEPMTCTACPTHSSCTPGSVTCEKGFVLQQHPIAQIPLVPQIFDGMPGFGPVAFPPTCVEDEERRRNIGRLGVALENHLAMVRGQRLCQGATRPVTSAEEAKQWGLDLDLVHDTLKKLTVLQKRVVKADEFEGLFEQAIADLQRFGYVVVNRDEKSGAQYIAALRTSLDLPCKIRVTARDKWNEWRRHFFVGIFTIICAYWARGKLAANRVESRRVSDLVQVVLDALQNQELAHHTDPVTTPHGYLSSIHLRDLILRDEHSIPARRRLWNKVEKVIEGNSNVRTSMEELKGGDEGRVWTWIGGTPRNNLRSP